MATQYDNAIQKLYVAYFNRPADAAGLAYYAGVVAAANGSTAAVSAEFAGSKEYKDAYGNMTTRDVVITIYKNLFGHAPDDAGRDYYVDAIVNKGLSIDKAVTEIAGGAKTTDLEAYENKVAFAEAFTGALKTDAEKAGYSGDLANAAAKAVVAGITTDASLAAAIDPATLSASIAAVIKAAVPFTLAGALQTLDAAQDAKADYLEAYGEANEIDDATDADVKAVQTDAETALTPLVTDYDATDSAGLKAAKLADQQKANSDALATQQKELTAANAEVAKVTGLASAIAAATSSQTVLESAQKANVKTVAALAGADTAFTALNSGATLTINADGTVALLADTLITFNSSGKLVLASGVKEADHPGITAVLNASIAKEASDLALKNAEIADLAADVQVAILDKSGQTAGTPAALIDLGEEFTIVPNPTTGTPPVASAPTAVQVATELNALNAAYNTAQAAANADAGNAAKATAAADALTARDDFVTAINTYLGVDSTNTTSTTQATEAADVKAAQKAIADLAEAVADLTAANADVAKLAAFDKTIKAASDVFAENKLAAPVVLGDVGNVAVAATAASDVYLASKDATVFGFGDLGTDYLYVGKGYTLNTGALSTGSDTKLEVFFVADGDNTVVTIETKAFGSSSAGEAEILITLTGVAPSELKLSADGIITLA
jgi:hypothetical protein